jgi:hypothetical protein
MGLVHTSAGYQLLAYFYFDNPVSFRLDYTYLSIWKYTYVPKYFMVVTRAKRVSTHGPTPCISVEQEPNSMSSTAGEGKGMMSSSA